MKTLPIVIIVAVVAVGIGIAVTFSTPGSEIDRVIAMQDCDTLGTFGLDELADITVEQEIKLEKLLVKCMTGNP